MKPLRWVGTALEDLRRMPEDARRIAGFQLYSIQQGLEPSDWKSMASVGTGVYELRIRTDAAYRVFYIAKFAEAVYVLHAFEKRTRKTSHADITLARTRLSQLEHRRRNRKE